jgi:hypothetical protein
MFGCLRTSETKARCGRLSLAAFGPLRAEAAELAAQRIQAVQLATPPKYATS